MPFLADNYGRFQRSLDQAVRNSSRSAMMIPTRTMRQFAEQEIIVPSGPYKDLRFSIERQPFTGLWFDLVDSGRWRRHFATGPVQASKTLTCSVTPTLYHLFECNQNVIYGVPTLDMVEDKWALDLLPVIEKTRYREFLPRRGGGSRGGGKASLIQFQNGAALRFMTAGGKDKSRAGFTAPVLVVTELDAFDEQGAKSREGDKFNQLVDRLGAFRETAKIYCENTVSIETGRTWQEYLNGTNTKIVRPCKYCNKWVTPTRENLIGWQEAESVVEASKALIHCPSCGHAWSEEDRYESNLRSVAVHAGQEITDDGEIVGEPRKTNTLSFRWDSVDNHMGPISYVAEKEWESVYGADSKDPDFAETTMRQKYWAIPPIPDEEPDNELNHYTLMKRMIPETQGGCGQRIVPAWATKLTMGVDVGKWLLHWVVVAWGPGGKSSIIEYGREEVPSKEMPEEQAVEIAIHSLFDKINEGFQDEEGNTEYPSLAFVDTQYLPDAVHRALEAIWKKQQDLKPPASLNFSNRVWFPIIGFGTTTTGRQSYSAPRGTGNTVQKIGEQSFLSRIERHGQKKSVFQINVDHWKSWLRRRLICKIEDSSAMSFYWSDAKNPHLSISKHFIAEKPVRKFVPGKGMLETWEIEHRNNHFLDAATYSATAAWWAGIRLDKQDEEAEPKSAEKTQSASRRTEAEIIKQQQSSLRGDGRPWIPRRK